MELRKLSHTKAALVNIVLVHVYAVMSKTQGGSTGHGSSTGSSTESAPKRTAAERPATQVNDLAGPTVLADELALYGTLAAGN